MTRIAARHSWLLARRFRAAVACLAILSGVALSTLPAYADPVHGEATLATENGYARLIVKLDEDVDSEVSVAGSILIIRFKRAVDVPVDQISDAVPDYVGSARRDPDGSAIRLALSRKVKVNSMVAGERLFIDLLPDSWKGMPPGLPPEVVRELSERARAAERALRQQQAANAPKPLPPVRVRASVQPTFVRYVFELPENAGVSSSLGAHKFSVVFDKPFKFDLADATLVAPANVGTIEQRLEGKSAVVDFALIGDVDVKAFREEKNYIVDVGVQPAALPPAPSKASQTAPASAPAAAKSASAAPQKASEAQSQAAVATKPVVEGATAPEPKVTELKPGTPPANVAAVSAPVKIEAPTTPAATPAADNVPVTVQRNSDGVRLKFAFDAATPAALFRRADAVWLLFDSTQAVDLDAIRRDAKSVVGEVSRIALPNGQAIRMRLIRPQLVALADGDGTTPAAPGQRWTLTFADTLKTSSEPLEARRNVVDPRRATITIPLEGAGKLHRLTDPDAGDTLLVVTAKPPARGFVKRQDMVELSVLESVQGVVVRPKSDDVTATVSSDSVTLARPGGLTLSSARMQPERATASVRPLFDDAVWRDDRAAAFLDRRNALIDADAVAEGAEKVAARLALARFYMAWGMYPEAKAVLDISLSEAKPGTEDATTLTMHALASSLIGRPEQTLKDLASPVIGNSTNAQLWKALAYARQQKWAAAREAFKNAELAIGTLPLELQRVILLDAMRASVEVKDYAGASARSDDLDAVGAGGELAPAVTVLRGRLAEGLGQEKTALRDYKIARSSQDRPAAAEATLLDVALRQKRDEISAEDALNELETLSALWRGDGIEVRTLQQLSHLYADAGRFAEALAASKTATRLQPNSEAARQAQDEASALFAQLYLSPKGDSMSPIDALATFYDYRELTPIGRRGDEMIRRLADRLIGVDLLGQAAELLQYQIDHRLEGAARAQVAARLAMVYLMNHKPDRAITALRSTRIADLAGELRQQRLLLEARAQSDIGRRDLALEIIANMPGREAIRLRSDIYWAGRRWRESAEQIELYYGERWRNFKPLDAVEKGDVIRAAIGYALADDALGLARFREKYAPLMAGEADRAAFDMASKPASATNADLVKLAKMAGSVDTLDGFLREMQARFPDAIAKAALPPAAPATDPTPTGSLPAIVGTKRADAGK
ncbi:MAG: tetratricopeptide repeat protein [Rhizobiales bacterium]|nr:tetratricopeptide repeat protein [Hyphomicrobiales bacterium]